jgi:hypothetical protein
MDVPGCLPASSLDAAASREPDDVPPLLEVELVPLELVVVPADPPLLEVTPASTPEPEEDD